MTAYSGRRLVKVWDVGRFFKLTFGNLKVECVAYVGRDTAYPGKHLLLQNNAENPGLNKYISLAEGEILKFLLHNEMANLTISQRAVLSKKSSYQRSPAVK